MRPLVCIDADDAAAAGMSKTPHSVVVPLDSGM